MRKCFLTLFYSGLSPIAPGTIGSIIAGIIGIPIVRYNPETIFLLGFLIGLIAIPQINLYEKEVQEHDSKEIVIDELVGMWIAMGIGGVLNNGFLMVILSFIFFRVYDITKPSIIGRIDKNVSGGLGVIGDDAIAGILAGISTLIVLKIYTLLHLPLF